jgi:hypothetical protein
MSMARVKKSDALAATSNAQVALEPWEQELAQEAKDEKARESVGLQRITHKGAEFRAGEQKLGNSIKLAIVDFIAENVYYSSPYDPDNPSTPDCYAFGPDEKALVAHTASPSPQNKQEDGSSPCASCKHNVYGSGKGRGKACRNTRRLLVISPVLDKDGKPSLDADGVAVAEKRQLSIPPSSLKDWSNYISTVKDLTRTGNVREMIVQVSTYGLDKGGHGLKFTPVQKVTPEGLKAIAALRASSAGALAVPYPVIDMEQAEEQQATKKQEKKIGKKVR